jgi:hypothetical protein
VQPLPDAGFLPVPQSSPARGPATAAELPREEPPGAAGAQDEDDASEDSAVGDAWAAALGLGWHPRQQRLDGFPEVVGDKR